MLVGREANAIAEKNSKKDSYRISAEHVAAALKKLGKQQYALEKSSTEVNETAEAGTKKKKRKVNPLKKNDMPSHEELVAEQNALFQKASMRAKQEEGW